MPLHSTPQPPSFEETPTPTDLQSTMAACRLNLNALLTYMVGKHGLEPERAARFMGRNTVRVIRDFRQEAQMISHLSEPDFQTQPILLVNRVRHQAGEKIEKKEPVDGEIEVSFVELSQEEIKGYEGGEKDAFDVEGFFSAPDPDWTPIGDTRILQMIEEELALSGKAVKGDPEKYKDLFDFEGEKKTPIAQWSQPVRSNGPLILPPLKVRNSGPVRRAHDTVFLTPTPAMAIEPNSLTSAILHFAEAEPQYRMTSDGRAEQTEKLELDFSDLINH